MKAATVKGFGFTAKVVVAENKKPVPSKHDVLVQVYCSSVNPKDWKLNKVMTSLAPAVGIRPFILGDDLSGIVVETGSEVTKFEVGDEVLAKDTTLMGGLWPLGSCITLVNSLDRDKWLAVVRCL